MKTPLNILGFLLFLWMGCCASDTQDEVSAPPEAMDDGMEVPEGVAQVTEVSVSGAENQYTFQVTIASDDLGCQQYADWWEVIDANGTLLYRRILAHSHVNEQPFTRSGGPVTITQDTEVYVRAHMNTSGYGEAVFKGSVAGGFLAESLDATFAEDLEAEAPLPSGCAF